MSDNNYTLAYDNTSDVKLLVIPNTSYSISRNF
jgi:hypothetical protein